MNKKRILILAGVALIVLLLAGLAGATLVFAQEPTPPIPFGWHGGGRGMGGFGGRGMGGFAWAGDGPWTIFDTAAEALGMTPEELFDEMRAGKNLTEIAEEQGVEVVGRRLDGRPHNRPLLARLPGRPGPRAFLLSRQLRSAPGSGHAVRGRGTA